MSAANIREPSTLLVSFLDELRAPVLSSCLKTEPLTLLLFRVSKVCERSSVFWKVVAFLSLAASKAAAVVVRLKFAEVWEDF